MADISKINPNDGTVYNIKDTTARDGLTDRPTSFVGTRSEWNALPVATQVKYSLVNLIGEGVYKNNGTGLDDIADVGGGASKNFQGTIEEWNALTTEQKKAYDHASIPDSLDGNVTFPASKVMILSGKSVESEINKYNSLIDNPLAHNGIYTGRNLGTISSASDWAAFRAKYGIADKSYKGLYLGDYVKVNDGTYNADWMVAGFNTETNKGSTNICPECVSMIPRVGDGCGTSYMNSTNVTTGGYKGSYMHVTKLPNVATKLTTIFGANLVTRDILVSNTVTNNYVSNWELVTAKCSLMSSVQVFGCFGFENTGGSHYAAYNTGEACEKLPVFNFISPVQFSRSHFWLRGVSSSTGFCFVNGTGYAYSGGASITFGVRPLICLS